MEKRSLKVLETPFAGKNYIFFVFMFSYYAFARQSLRTTTETKQKKNRNPKLHLIPKVLNMCHLWKLKVDKQHRLF